MGCVYCLSFPNGKRYVGMTSFSLARRIKEHTSLAQGSAKNKKAIHFAISKHGIDRVVVTEIFDSEDEDFLKFAEIFSIEFIGSVAPNGYNLTAGGEGAKNPPIEVRDKISAAGKGRKQTQETKDKIRIANKGKKKSAEHIEKMKLSCGKKWNEERKLRFAEFRTGKKNTQETKEAMKRAALARWRRQRENGQNLQKEQK